ncbi:hypothetical protein ACWOAH_01065 [Vagococcus vulneris]|uniref:Uncharacterized protein n=1 Tax=Vagococcus vulneris TaxID=1977869 RepID=A0A430A227_9ENTE|nr:hypothetical protein [Vagococcus vulneris]RSU00523.1 hypothetical protein CBF37_00475 [Vagococcus vulneris]
MVRQSDKRKYFRFPAYDDNEGVKRKSQRNREMFDGFLNDGFDNRRKQHQQIQSVEIDRVEMTDEPDYFGSDRMENQKQEYSSAPRKSISTAKTPFHDKQIVLPDKQIARKNYSSDSTQESLQSEQADFSNKFIETDRLGIARYKKHTRPGRSLESSYHLPGENPEKIFTPKYIPASTINDSVPANNHDELKNKERISESLKEIAESNRLIMEFDSDMLDEDNEISDEKAKHQRLDKSLSGIIANEDTSSTNQYFN